MNDHDADLRRLLDDHVDRIVGPERAAPPFEPTGTGRTDSSGGRPRRLVLAVSALAAAAAVAVAAVAVTQGVLRTDPTPRIAAPPSPSAPATPPATSAPPTAPTPGPEESTQRPTTSTSSTAGTPDGQPSNPADPEGTPTSVGGARLVIPLGWTVTPRTGTVFAESWCLQPAGGDCTISFSRHDPDGTQALDVDVPGGLDANPQYCDPTGTGNRTEGDTGVRDLGGREAEWRRWSFTCGADGRTVRVEQYVVASAPGYVLVSEQADAETAAVMADIAADSTLPAADRPVRLVDRGIVRSVTPTADGVRIELDRIYLDPDASGGISNVNPATYRYLIPTAVVDALGADLEVGGRYRLTSDGERVTRVDAE